ncbi:MAG: aminoacetone oxidase family FAD-binding enzyme [Candidatus Gastranaerophilales bacterium]|nr:aminoacetone oxidase family FAD-binding enzyme [Candidatus Gastranaerophilales bacterium]
MKIAIIGGGPSGFMAAVSAKENHPEWDITIFEKAKPLSKLLMSGGGRCNITNAEFDFKELAANYPRGEKFLYSVFSRFGVGDLFEFFNKYGIELYIQEDKRVFPTSDKASDIKDVLIGIAIGKGIKIKNHTEVFSVVKNEKFLVNDSMSFDKIILATGGANKFGYKIAKSFGHGVSDLAPCLCGFVLESPFTALAGVSISDVLVKAQGYELKKDLIFTHKGLSGPVIFDLSSYLAFANLPFELELNFTGLDFEEQDKAMIDLLSSHPKKNISNLLCECVPSSVAEELLKRAGISQDKKAFEVNSSERKKITEFLTSLKVNVIAKDTAMVTAGGINLDELDKNLQSKLVEGLYFCGEILNIDGLCGGYNLQACFSTGYVVGNSL